ncbi:YihY/virulence factor BrkB family protein [Bacteroides eggerthii]|jgi:membrane protein|uniref:tRNA-processing RNAse BN n=1 Tax=Bacteroides eggerthii TaxID=28111 RepID=A0A380YJA1_9BACE|nr:YihY/virulence factor BrkB family protein [Bacteroides eggerthii]EEC53975.1 YihY family protein [Bacteroides eggerthii DSM 20697]QRQ47909.1 YihY/virulence factor BrkB family protein [Bacteroides eggerthii]UWN86543.1 YihY/virulence factor BrkB family protein [Bacteroides eggerthii]SUV28915.1 tRNA-processing RNAse BN [Bacteroides eggerthii]
MNKRIATLWKFLTYDIWRITEDEVTKTTFSLYNIIKTIYLCINRFTKDRLVNKASALTYSTLLAIVPILAIVFAIARGFGFDNLMESQIVKGFGGPSETTEVIFQFVNSYLSQTKSGIFIGIGLIMLLWTVLNLINNMEITFNRIWQVKKARSMYRKITDYFSMLLLIPLLLVVSGGLSIFMSTMLKNVADFTLLAPIGKFLIRLIPFVLTWFMFTGLYVFMPNTKVKLKHALISGVLTGTAHQAFQFLYISSQLWVSRYNAIYGSFAALPMFLLWLQISWTICLFGAELTYAGQNIRNFSFDKDARNISRRYRDFISILIMSLIAKRFEKNEPPYTAEDISEECQIPIRLTNQTLYELQEINLLHEVVTDAKSQDIAYQPSMDINKLNVALLLDKLDTHGSEDFKIDKDKEFHGQWETLMKAREEYFRSASRVLLKDL